MTDRASPRRRVERAMPLGSGKPVEQFATRRTCEYPGCMARLSRYNPNPTCSAHGGWTGVGRGRGGAA